MKNNIINNNNKKKNKTKNHHNWNKDTRAHARDKQPRISAKPTCCLRAARVMISEEETGSIFSSISVTACQYSKSNSRSSAGTSLVRRKLKS